MYTCSIIFRRYFLLDYVKNTVMQIGVEHTPPYNARVGSGFLLVSYTDCMSNQMINYHFLNKAGTENAYYAKWK
jgi:hypothetical protein